MPKCLECGIVLPRLQWTHFKYKCTGRFSNGTEYKKEYPDAKLVDEEIARKTTLSEENFIKKYGHEEGIKRWNTYRQKQAYSNTYEYKSKNHGWTREQYDNFNKSRAVTIDNLIDKYGKEEAEKRFKDYCDRQAYTCTPEYFIKQYGDDEGKRKYNNFCKKRMDAVVFNAGIRVSKVEFEVLQTLRTICQNIEHQFIISGNYFGPYDFGCRYTKKVIEFYGSYWHCDPRVYDDGYYHTQIGKSAGAIRRRDHIKRKYALDKGYEVFVIWELDWVNDKDKIIKYIERWWNGYS